MRLSICICTYKRNEDLVKCLDSLAACEPSPFQVIVSDDAHCGECRELVEKHLVGGHYIPGPGRGLAANRNNALQAVSGTHISFLDDDTTVEVDFVKHIQEAVAEVDEKTVVTGYEMRKTPEGYAKVTAANANFLGYMRVPSTDENRCNIVINATVFPAEVFRDIHFDERLVFGCEEIDIARQCRWVGYQIRFNERLFIHHHHSLANREENRSKSDGSRIYATFKNYYTYEGAFLKALAYLAIGSVHTTCHRLLKDRTTKKILSLPETLYRAWKKHVRPHLR